MPVAPWLPPTTRITGRAGSRPSATLHARASLGRKQGRTGVPVTVMHEFFSLSAAEGKPTKARLTTRESQRLARPGIVFDSWRNVRAPQVLAASTGGALVKPPMAITAF